MEFSVMGSAEVEADRHLLVFKSYEDYLSSLLTPIDFHYLRSSEAAQLVAQLGYRYAGEVLTRESFNKRIAAAEELLHPRKHKERVSGDYNACHDRVLLQLVLREKANRIGKLQTIIFIRVASRIGAEISGYIDFAQRLRIEPWTPIFQGRKVLRPYTTDLGYYNWRTGYSICNHSENYKIILDPVRGLQFQNVCDHLVMTVDPAMISPGPSTRRTRLSSPRYLSVILYDHKVRRKC